jgi:hypothetical protein
MTETRFPNGINGGKNTDLDIWSDSDIALYPQGNIWISQGTKLIFEGTIPDDYEVKLQATTVTADRDIILPDASGTVAVSVSDTSTSTQGDLNLDFTLSATGNISATGYAFGMSTGSSPTFLRVTLTSVPATSKGAAGDKLGMIAADASYLYVCTANYTTGVADIWSRTAIAASTW